MSSPCLIEGCKIPAILSVCPEHRLLWVGSPEEGRLVAAWKRKAPFAVAIQQNAEADFIRRISAELRNGAKP